MNDIYAKWCIEVWITRATAAHPQLQFQPFPFIKKSIWKMGQRFLLLSSYFRYFLWPLHSNLAQSVRKSDKMENDGRNRSENTKK